MPWCTQPARASSSPSAPNGIPITSGSKPKTSAAPGAAGRRDGRPHGLDVVEALTGPDGWGVEITTGGRRVVWARLDLV